MGLLYCPHLFMCSDNGLISQNSAESSHTSLLGVFSGSRGWGWVEAVSTKHVQLCDSLDLL